MTGYPQPATDRKTSKTGCPFPSVTRGLGVGARRVLPWARATRRVGWTAATSRWTVILRGTMPNPRSPSLASMLRLTELQLPIGHPPEALPAAICARLGLAETELLAFTVFKRSYDARKKTVELSLVYTLDCEVRDEAAVRARFADDPRVRPAPDMRYRPVAQAPSPLRQRPVVIGFGPCGLFAALTLAQMGFRPLVLERGRPVRQRTQDTWGLWRRQVLDPTSNVQFGEGGAGLFSDGKLWSQVRDPQFHGRKVLQEFVKAGAPEEILYVSKPHIGTFRLTGVVTRMREEIEALGGEVRFGQPVTDVLIEDGRLRGLVLQDGETLEAEHVVLALGHSARDTFRMLHARGVRMDAKPFSIGFRIEHPQSLIDRARLGPYAGHPLIGAADYKLVHHARNGRSVYSFCMCPGGTVVAATSEPGCVVTNGMSQYSRNERNANAGIVVGIAPEDYPGGVAAGPLAGIALQEALESRAYQLGGENYCAPAQRVGDFLAGRASTALGPVEPSYKPGVRLCDLAEALPDYAITAIREALPVFDRQIQGFALPDAVLTGVETRTSSPLRIPRDAQYQSLNTRGLYPAGEGAGYAGGIMSAGIDGIRVAEALALAMTAATPR